MISLNQNVMPKVRQIIASQEKLGCKLITTDCGTKLIDMGINCRGSWEAGLLYARVMLGDLGIVQLGQFPLSGDYTLSSVEIHTNDMLTACFGSQIAGWVIRDSDDVMVVSGPGRALAAAESDQFIHLIDYRDNSTEAVLCVQRDKYPSEALITYAAEACGVHTKDLYLLIAPDNCIVGSIQVASRFLEQASHKLYSKGLDPGKVLHCRGSAPIAPVIKDPLKAMGRINDALVYGSELEIWIDANDSEIAKAIHQIVGKTSSPNYNELFQDIFVKGGGAFYLLDPDVNSVGRIQIHNINTGRAFCAGEINYELLRRSFLI